MIPEMSELAGSHFYSQVSEARLNISSTRNISGIIRAIMINAFFLFVT